MTSPAKPTIGHFAFACSILLAVVCGIEFLMIQNIQAAADARIANLDVRIANLENAVATVERRLSVQIIPLAASGAK